MKKLIQRLALGTALLATGAGIATPIAFNAGNKQGYDAGRESARPVSIRVDRTTGDNYHFLESACVKDARGEVTSMWQYNLGVSESVSKNFPNDGYLMTQDYHTEKPN